MFGCEFGGVVFVPFSEKVTCNVMINRCDVSKEDEWQDLWTHTETAFGGKVSLLVNNAGINPKHGWKACINIMLTGVGYGTFLALEKMGISKVCILFVVEKIKNLVHAHPFFTVMWNIENCIKI